MISTVEFAKEAGGIHKLSTGSREILAKTVIISTGATAKYLGLDDEKNTVVEVCLLVLLVMVSLQRKRCCCC